MDPFFVFLSQVYYALIISMISRPSKRLMLIVANQRWHIIHTSLEHSKENSSLEQSPEQNLDTDLKINNVELGFQLLVLIA